uniref:Uncharacterized protein n=1 Tax=Physcomitrium patens TaxID=3218 RepID=A0A2K1JKP9_PHYPA|nr:hypothetical protein PHYPA_016971 [Physcomitrium patens]
MSHSLYQTEDPYENQDATMKKTVKEFKVKQSPIDGYQYKDSRFQTEKNYIERSHCQIRWKTPTDVSSDLENSREITLCNKALPAGKKSNDGGNSFSRATLCSNPCQQKEQITRAASKTIHCGKDFPCKSKAQNVDPNRVGESLCHPNVLPDNEGFPEFTNPLTGWVYHTNNGTISKFYTLKQLQRGLKSGFLPANLPIYQVQENIYTGPFVLKLLIERNEFLASHTMNDLQQPMEMKNLDYVHNMKSKLTTHALNVRPLSHGPTPVLTTTVWPNAKMGSAIAAAEQQQQHYLHQHKGDDNQGDDYNNGKGKETKRKRASPPDSSPLPLPAEDHLACLSPPPQEEEEVTTAAADVVTRRQRDMMMVSPVGGLTCRSQASAPPHWTSMPSIPLPASATAAEEEAEAEEASLLLLHHHHHHHHPLVILLGGGGIGGGEEWREEKDAFSAGDAPAAPASRLSMPGLLHLEPPFPHLCPFAIPSSPHPHHPHQHRHQQQQQQQQPPAAAVPMPYYALFHPPPKSKPFSDSCQRQVPSSPPSIIFF